MQPNSRQVIMLGATGLIFSIAILVYMFIFYFSNGFFLSTSENTTQQVASSSVITLEGSGSADDWRQEVVEVENPNPELTPRQAPEPTETGLTQNEMRNEPIDTSQIGVRATLPNQRTSPAAPRQPTEVIPDPDPIRVEESISLPVELPTVSINNPINCGLADFSESTFGIFGLLRTVDTDPAVICLGEAIGASCTNAVLQLGTGATSLKVYATSAGDARCSVGISEGPDNVLLCDVLQMYNQSVMETKSWSALQGQFTADPGGTMSVLIQGNFLDIQRGNTDKLGCANYRLQ